jgi:putative aldouronate transport system permease protein
MGAERYDRLGWFNKLFDMLNGLFLLLLMATMIVPFLNVISLSLSSDVASMRPDMILFPHEFSTHGYFVVWKSLDLWRPFLNNVFVTGTGTVLHVLFSALAGFVLIYRSLPGRRTLVTFILITMMIPQDAIMIPLYIVNKDLHLIDKLPVLVLSGMVSGFSILLMRNFFLTVPFEMMESAKMDGAGDLRIFTTLYLPLARAGLATVTLFEFVGRWNMFTPAVMFINSQAKYTLQVALKSMIIDSNAVSSNFLITTNVRMAGIIISIIPLLLIYPFVQKYFMKGIMLGSTKE